MILGYFLHLKSPFLSMVFYLQKSCRPCGNGGALKIAGGAAGI
jgi:hypothetical protein